MSREKALTIGYDRPKDTEVSVNSLAHCCLNTASLFVMPVYKSVKECRYRSTLRKLLRDNSVISVKLYSTSFLSFFLNIYKKYFTFFKIYID